MPQVDPVILRLSADVRDYTTKVSQAQKLSDQKLDAMERRSASMAAGVNRSFSLAAKAAIGYVSVTAAIDLGREFLRIADAAKSMEAQLRLATRESGSFAQAQEDVRRISSETRSSLEATTQLYSTFQRNALELGISQEEAARATETVSKAFQISGATAAEAAGGLRQFLQGLQSGALRGEELNSVLENAPRLAKLLADSLGVTVGQLRAMGQEGDLAAEKLIAALTDRKFTDGIDAEFRELPVTFDQAMTQVENAATIVFGAFDRGGQFSTALANFVTDGSRGFEDMEAAALTFGQNTRSEIEALTATFGPLISEVTTLLGLLDSGAGNKPLFGKLFGEIDAITGGLAAASNNSLVKLLSGRAGMPGTAGTNLQGPYLQQYNDTQRRLQRDASYQAIAPWLQRYDALGNPVGGTRAPRPATTPAGGRGGRRSGGGGRSSAETAARRAEQERLRAIRDEASDRRDLARLDDELQAARGALVVAANDILSFELDQIDREKAQRIEDLQTQVRIGDLTQEEANRRAETVEQIAQANKQRAFLIADEARAARDAVAARDAIETQKAEASLIRSREARRDAEQNILDLTYQEEEYAIRRAAANGDIANLDEALANMKRRQLVDQETLRRSSMSPGQSYLAGLADEAENLGDAYENVAVRGLDRMASSFADATKNALGLHGVLGDIVGDLIEIAIRQAVIKPLANAIFGGIGSIFGGATAALGGNAGGVPLWSGGFVNRGRASGGYVSAGSMYRVNEGASPGRVEGFIPQGAGHIVPLGRMNAAAARGGGTVIQQFHLDVRGAVMTPDLIAQMNAIGARAAVAGSQLGASQAQASMAARGRRRIPG